jgi:hypothetical protein
VSDSHQESALESASEKELELVSVLGSVQALVLVRVDTVFQSP